MFLGHYRYFMPTKKDSLFSWLSPKASLQGASDTKTIYDKRGKEKQVSISISEKKQELRKELYTQVQALKSKKHRNKTANDLVALLKLQEYTKEKYPHTNEVEYKLIENLFLERLK